MTSRMLMFALAAWTLSAGRQIQAGEYALPMLPEPPVVTCDECGPQVSGHLPYSGSWFDSHRFYLNVEATFLVPHLRDAPPAVQFFNLGAGTSFAIPRADVEDLVPAPRIELGVIRCDGWGLQARYWQMQNAAHRRGPIAAGGGALLDPALPFEAWNRIGAYHVDLELTRDLWLGESEFLATIGVRHASLQRDEFMSGMALLPDGVGGLDLYTAQASSAANFHGTGLTFSLSGVHPLYSSMFDLFWSARGSALRGKPRSWAAASASLAGPDAFAAAFTSAELREKTRTMWIGELQLGLQWSREIHSINARTFARIGMEYQHWRASQGVIDADAFAAVPGAAAAAAATERRRLALGLIGFTASAGFFW